MLSQGPFTYNRFDLYEKSLKPDYLDMDKDGDKKESMKKAIKEKGKCNDCGSEDCKCDDKKKEVKENRAMANGGHRLVGDGSKPKGPTNPKNKTQTMMGKDGKPLFKEDLVSGGEQINEISKKLARSYLNKNIEDQDKTDKYIYTKGRKHDDAMKGMDRLEKREKGGAMAQGKLYKGTPNEGPEDKNTKVPATGKDPNYNPLLHYPQDKKEKSKGLKGLVKRLTRKEELESLHQAYLSIISDGGGMSGGEQLDEISLKTKIKAYASAQDPDDERPEQGERIMKNIVKNHGEKAGKHAYDHEQSYHYGRGPSAKERIEPNREYRTTKAGKMHGQDQKKLKSDLKKNRTQKEGVDSLYQTYLSMVSEGEQPNIEYLNRYGGHPEVKPKKIKKTPFEKMNPGHSDDKPTARFTKADREEMLAAKKEASAKVTADANKARKLQKEEATEKIKAKSDKSMKVYGGPAYIKKPKDHIKEETVITKEDVIAHLIENNYVNNEVSAEAMFNHITDEFLEEIESNISEGFKPLPKEKMARQANKAYGQEQRAVRAGDEAGVNKQMQRRIAMTNPSGRKAQLSK